MEEKKERTMLVKSNASEENERSRLLVRLCAKRETHCGRLLFARLAAGYFLRPSVRRSRPTNSVKFSYFFFSSLSRLCSFSTATTTTYVTARIYKVLQPVFSRDFTYNHEREP